MTRDVTEVVKSSLTDGVCFVLVISSVLSLGTRRRFEVGALNTVTLGTLDSSEVVFFVVSVVTTFRISRVFKLDAHRVDVSLVGSVVLVSVLMEGMVDDTLSRSGTRWVNESRTSQTLALHTGLSTLEFAFSRTILVAFVLSVEETLVIRCGLRILTLDTLEGLANELTCPILGF